MWLGVFSFVLFRLAWKLGLSRLTIVIFGLIDFQFGLGGFPFALVEEADRCGVSMIFQFRSVLRLLWFCLAVKAGLLFVSFLSL